MIFVTVGTFCGDQLIEATDQISLDIGEKIIAQIGQGKYEPKNIHFFRFEKSLDSYYKKANLIIGHGGAGTLFEILNLGKHFIGVSSPEIPDKHQVELLDKFSSDRYILWCKDLDELKKYIHMAKIFQFRKYQPPSFHMDKTIIDFLHDSYVKYNRKKN
jgi:beta-1,4-N-acetylglucosaminyltransferase